MAQLPYQGGVPQVDPETRAPNNYQRIQTDPSMFGGAIGAGLERLGSGLTHAGQFYGQVAADDGANKYIDGVNKILHGDPEKKTIGPDGKETAEVGYMGLTGANAMRAYPDVAKRLKDLREEIRKEMPAGEAGLLFDRITRPEYARRVAMAGTKADNEFKTYGRQVNEASLKQATDRAFQHWSNPEESKHAEADIVDARVKTAMLMGARPGDELYSAAIEQGKRDALGARVKGMAVHDPAGAMELLKKNEKLAGPEYPALEAWLKPKKEEAVGEAAANSIKLKTIANVGHGVVDVNGNPNPENFRNLMPSTQASVQRMAGIFGRPLVITPHGGTQPDSRASTSQHHHGKAIDLSVADMDDATKSRLVASAVAAGATGFGAYSHGQGVGTIHVDWRSSGGKDPSGLAIWHRTAEGDKGLDTAPQWFRDGIRNGLAQRGVNLVQRSYTLDRVSAAILGQESGGRFDIGNSIDGARGIGQIMPETFARFAKPGEKIDNPQDNLAVHQRMIATYAQKYGDDPARIAVAYFSGEGNVSPPGSATPWLRDAVDGNGKRTSSYVSDILRRIDGGTNYRMPGSFGGAGDFGLRGPTQRSSSGVPFALPITPSKEDARQQIWEDPNLNYREKSIAISRVDQHYAAMTGERNAIAAAMKNDELSILDSGVPVKSLTPERVAAAYGAQIAATFMENRSIAQTYYQRTKEWGTMSNEDIDASLATMDPRLHAAGSDNYGKHKEYYDKAVEKADAIKKQRATDPAASVGDQPSVKAAMKGASLDKPESYQRVIEARMLAQENVGVLVDNRMPLARAEAKLLWEPIRLASDSDRSDVIGETLKQIDVMTGGDRERASTAFQQILASGGADKDTRKIGANLWRKLVNNQPITREEGEAFDAANRTALAMKAQNMLAPTRSPDQQIIDYYHAAGQDIPADVAKQYGITPEVAKRKPTPPGQTPKYGSLPELSPKARDEAKFTLLSDPTPARAAQYDAVFGEGSAAKLLASAPPPSEDHNLIIARRELRAAYAAQVEEQLRAIGEGKEPVATTPTPAAPITRARPEITPSVSDAQRQTAQALRGDVVEAQMATPEKLAAYDAETKRQITRDMTDQLKGIETERKVAQRMAEGAAKTMKLDALKRKEAWLKEQIEAAKETR